MKFKLSRNKYSESFETQFGEYLQTEIEKMGFIVTIPTVADWGYAFRTTYNNRVFDIIIEYISETDTSVSITPILGFFDKIFRRNDNDKCQSLQQIINSLHKKFKG